MDMVADRVWETRERTFHESRDGESLMQTTAWRTWVAQRSTTKKII